MTEARARPHASDAPREDEILAEGAVVDDGRLRVVYDIAKGSMARVYLANEVDGGREVALKVLGGKYARRADAAPRLFAEAEYAGALRDCRYVVHVLRHGHLTEAGGAAFLVMEYVDGPTLMGHVRGTSPVFAERCKLLRDVASAISAAHAAGIIHRDIKPRNVLVCSKQDAAVAKLGDFGIAIRSSALAAVDDRLTAVHERLGTKHYMAPEQCTGGLVTHAADVYAWGVTAYEVLVGEPPFGARPEVEVVQRKCDPSLPGFSLSSARPGLPEQLRAIVDRALAFAPSERPDAAEICATLDILLSESLRHTLVDVVLPVVHGGTEPVDAPEPETPLLEPGESWVAWIPWVLAAVVSLVLVVGALHWIDSAVDPRADDQANQEPAVIATPTQADASPIQLVDVAASPNPPAPTEPSLPANTSNAPERVPWATPPPSTVGGGPPPVPPQASKPVREPVAAAPKPKPAHDSDACIAARDATTSALKHADWNAILEHTKSRSCWADAGARTQARVRALFGLSRWKDCAREGAGAKDSRTQGLVTACEERGDSK